MSTLQQKDIERLKEICLLLNKSMDAFAYYSNIGFQNALGDFEIDENSYEISKPLIDEFNNILNNTVSTVHDYIVCSFDDEICNIFVYELKTAY